MKELIIRTLSGILFVALMVCAILYSKILFTILFAIILVGCLYEFYLLRGYNSKSLFYAALILYFLLFIFFDLFINEGVVSNEDICSTQYRPIFYIPLLIISALVLIFLFVVHPIYAINQKRKYELMTIYSAHLYIVLPLLFLSLFHLYLRLTFGLFLMIWGGDVGAYCIGTLFGQGSRGHKLAPSISPKKSWEGVIGGAIFVIIISLILRHYSEWFNWPFASIWVTILFALLFFAAAVIGDLFESYLKRKKGVKDSGNVLPGHGGFLDRFDSALFAFPLSALFIFIYLICSSF